MSGLKADLIRPEALEVAQGEYEEQGQQAIV